jgi:hypothetical protein
MDEKRRDYFARVVYQSKQLSECTEPKAALIVRGKSICGVGYNRTILPKSAGKLERAFETYPVFGALQESFSRSNFEGIGQGDEEHRGERAAFLTYFPHIDELILLYEADIKKVYFIGDIDDIETKDFLDEFMFFEIIQIEI